MLGIYLIYIVGFSYFHENYLVDELSLLYRLLKKVGQLNICAKYFTNYIKVCMVE